MLAVRMVTDDVARAFGLIGRGRLDIGYAADVVVFDEAEGPGRRWRCGVICLATAAVSTPPPWESIWCS